MSLQQYLTSLSKKYDYCRMEHLYIELAMDASLHGNYEYMLELLQPLHLPPKYIRSLIPKGV